MQHCLASIFTVFLVCLCPALAGDAPQWMHAVANVALPDHDEKTDAVLLYSERTVSVQSVEKTKTHVRVVYKILRPSGRWRSRSPGLPAAS